MVPLKNTGHFTAPPPTSAPRYVGAVAFVIIAVSPETPTYSYFVHYYQVVTAALTQVLGATQV